MLFNVFENKIINETKPVNVIGLNKAVQAFYVWNLFDVTKDNILIVTNTLYEANNLYKSFNITDSKKVLFFPMDDFIASEMAICSPDLTAKRVETLNELVTRNDKKIIITNLMGYLRFLPSVKLWKSLSINLKVNDYVKRDEIIKKLSLMGYQRQSIVTKTGEFANRGYILDVFPYGYENPVRIEFFDDQIDSIRFFSADTQLSMIKKDDLNILPFTEFINEKEVDSISPRQSLLPLVCNETSSLSDYISSSLTVFIDLESINLSYQGILEQTIEFKQTDDYKIDKYMYDLQDLIPNKYVNILSVDNYKKTNDKTETYFSSLIPKFNGDYEKINKFVLNEINKNKTIIVFLNDKKMISDFCENLNFSAVITNEEKISPKTVNIIEKNVLNGFILNDLVCISQNELYKVDSLVKYESKFRYGSKIKDINKLKVGDYVVHVKHGIARYLGIVTLNVKDMKKDYLHLEYKDGDKLYVPVEKIEQISKYSSNEGAVAKLNKLGGTDWVKQKARIKGKVKDIAKKLLETSAKRKLVKGFPFLKDDEEQLIFESKFNYEETKDQLKAVQEIKEDMQNPYPMDRLLCGDVGYGKTEVAFRAAFKAISSGKQVAFLCPTTILSKQHYNNAKERFKDFNINIEVLNRFVTDKKKNEILKDLESGKTDLIIGTHRLLSNDVKYKDLGLLIIDEEQRFGVTHKEKIKEYKQSIDVLTLSATPIPRTLQMSLTGVRELSLIETPPAFRFPIQTYVLRENEQVIKDAIYKELSRDGQVFLLYNNVLKIEDQVSRIKRLVPEANVTYIHGQMNKLQIENTMEDFVDKKYNVLVCTTIIETGIDIENANTLIVLNADCFGLSQLYQIRGRIGRGKNIAYAYLMYDKNKELNDVAVKRLDAIKEFTELGSGYALAVRDLAIRGAGNILGSEQSGFIDTVGYDMYLKILNEEVERLKGNLPKEEEQSFEQPLIQVTTHISDKYADSEDLKIEIHKKINTIDSYDSFTKVKNELNDRFGLLDNDMMIYMLEELFDQNARKKGVFKVDQTKDNITVFLDKKASKKQDGLKLLTELFKISNNFDVKYINDILRINLKIKGLEKHFLYYLIKMIDIFE